MLTISSDSLLSRRALLTIGGWGCGGLALSSLLAGQVRSGEAARLNDVSRLADHPPIPTG